MAKAGYSATTGAAVALAAAATKSALSIIAPAQFGIDLKKLRISFDGTTATAAPIECQLCSTTGATAGTSTAGTVNQIYGRTITPGFTTGYNFTVEPTVLTILERWHLDPNKSTLLYDWPLGDTPDSAVSQGFVLRFVTPAAVTANLFATLYFERC